MTSWTELPLAAFDLETTSPDPHTARIVTACVLRVDGGDVTRRHWVADPGIPIPAEATEIHGYSDEYVQKHGRPHDEVLAEVIAELRAVWAEGRALAIYNGSFDLSLIAAHAPGFAVGGLVVDPFVLDKRVARLPTGSGVRKLGAVAARYGVELGDAHNAESDALATARLAWKLPRLYPELAAYSSDELMQQQQHWYREHVHQLIDRMRHNGRDYSHVRTEWPIQATPESEAA